MFFMKKIYFIITFLSVIVLFCACQDQDDTYIEIPLPPKVTVNVDLTKVPYQNLSEYLFFEGEIKNQNPKSNVIPYKPASSLFTDYALKKRFVYVPSGNTATFNSNENVFDLPTGSVLIKTFYYNNVQPNNTTRLIETRLMIKKQTGWIFAEYIWNEAQTEATLNMTGSYTNVDWLQNGIPKSVNYRIPSETECFICHKQNSTPIPIGIKPQNLNTNYKYSVSETKNQLVKWKELGLISNNVATNFEGAINYEDLAQPLEKRVRSYIDINCAHCHQNNSHCDYRAMRFAFSETTKLQNLGVCLNTEDLTVSSQHIKIVQPNNLNRSMLYYRLNTTNESFRMPLLGRTIIHEESVQMIQTWINSLTPCN